jgi:hypothetical protein
LKKLNKKKLLAIALVIVFALSLSATAFAQWPSFQNGNDNNGVITPGPAPTTQPTVTTAKLSRNNPSGNMYSGIDTTSVIFKDHIYTLYNGGDTQGFAGGARVRATDPTGVKLWDIQLDAQASNDNQLSTPYVDIQTGTLYAAIQFSTPIFSTVNVGGVTGWTPSTGVTIDSSGMATIPSGGGTISTTITLDDSVNYIYLPTDLSGSDGTYSITLDGTTLDSGSVSSYGTYGTYNGIQISQGQHTLTISVTGNTSNVTVKNVTLTRYDWRLYSVDLSGSKTLLVGNATEIDPAYEGQPNTPIGYDNSGNIYWGIYGGTHSYYQYNISSAALTSFKPAVSGTASGYDDFYGAGAAYVPLDNTMVFGSDNGIIYKQNAANFTSTVNTLTLSGLQPDAGQVRSTAVFDGGKFLYFTSKGTGTIGYLWEIDINLGTPTPQYALPYNSTSTPVLSASGIIYVGTYGYNPTTFASVGTVEALTPSLNPLATIYNGDPVQASPIVWSDVDDYIYFTTNSGTGGGWCYSFDGSTAAQVWTSPNTSANVYSVQGMASSEGYVVWGDDGNYLYIAH